MPAKDDCIDHLNFTNAICPDCGLEVDAYGNTEAQPFDYCGFPDCGCDGARLCICGKPSEHALRGNVEGMWQRSDRKSKAAVLDLVAFVSKRHD